MPKRIDFSAKELRQIERLARFHTQDEIAEILEISSKTLRRKVQSDARVLSSYKKGKAKLNGAIARTLIFKALSGDTTCMIFYLKCQAGWRETDPKQVEPSKIANLSEKQLEQERKRMGLVR